jgi:hypothetical protein
MTRSQGDTREEVHVAAFRIRTADARDHGREISSSGTRDLPWGMDSITGYNIIEAESLDEAEELAKGNPYIASIRVYELRSM